MNPHIYSKQQAASILGLCLRSVDRLIENRDIAIIQLSSRRVGIRADDLETYIAARRRPAVGEAGLVATHRGPGRARLPGSHHLPPLSAMKIKSRVAGAG